MLADQLVQEFRHAREETNRYSVLNFMYFVKAKYIRINLIYSGYVYKSVVEHVTDRGLEIEVSQFRETTDRRIIITLEALNRYYIFETVLLAFSGDIVTARIPEALRFQARRRHARIRFDDMFLRFIILYSSILDTREEEKAMENRHPHFLQEVLKDSPSLNIVYQMFTREIQNITRDFSLHMFEKIPESERSPAEKILAETGMPVLIQDTALLKSYIEPISSRKVTNLHSYFETLKNEDGTYEALRKMEEIKKSDSRLFLVSYLMLPISAYGIPIGYIRLETNQFDKYYLSLSAAEELVVPASLFSYAITKIRIRNSHFDPGSVQTRIVNLSLTGLLMEMTDETLYYYLQTHRRIKMIIPVKGEEVEVFGEIIRYFEEGTYYYLGVSFFSFRPGDMILLENYIYESLHYQFF